jgi:hypothetical protein
MKAAACCTVLALILSCAGCQPKARITVRVVDDDGKSVEGAEVTVLGLSKEETGETDRQGSFTATVRNGKSSVDLVADKKGFYSIHRHIYEFAGGLTNGRWIPWNPEVELQSRRKGKPARMIEKKVEEYLPVLNASVGYDLVIGDWVQPHGLGRTNDFVFSATRNLANRSEPSGALELRFTCHGDGLIQRKIHLRNDYGLRLPSLAPISGYSNRWLFSYSSKLNSGNRQADVQSSSSEDDNYYVRIRSQVNERGEIVTALYGKIHWGIHYALGDTNLNPMAGHTNSMPWVRFLYYLNPDGTRNTESERERQHAEN